MQKILNGGLEVTACVAEQDDPMSLIDIDIFCTGYTRLLHKFRRQFGKQLPAAQLFLAV